MHRAGVEPGRRYTIVSRSGDSDDAVTELEDDGGRASPSRTGSPVPCGSASRSAGRAGLDARRRVRRAPLLGADRWDVGHLPRRDADFRLRRVPGVVLRVGVAVGHDERDEARDRRGERSQMTQLFRMGSSRCIGEKADGAHQLSRYAPSR